MQRYPVIPLRAITIFPKMVLGFDVGRERSRAALDIVMEQEQTVFLVAQKDDACEEPEMNDLQTMGTIAHVRQTVLLQDDMLRVVVEGQTRAQLIELHDAGDYTEADVLPIQEPDVTDISASEAMMRGVSDLFDEYTALSARISPETMIAISTLNTPGPMADSMAANVLRKQEQKQEILDTVDPLERLEKMRIFLMQELEIQRIEQRVGRRLKEQMDRNNREYFLHEQIKAMQNELGEDEVSAREELMDRVMEAPLDEETKEKALKEMGRLKRMPANSPESPVLQTYIEWILDLPWGNETQDSLDLEKAESILNEDHYGLDKVKERIIEYLAVKKLTRSMHGPILCFVGPPGVGKTSIVRSIARAVNRKFVRMSLGGVRDEAEIVGHRRTYIGAIPGRIISNMKLAGTMNPVFLFDEIDKMSHDFRGDPASAMLEVLDPEQNNHFRDHYMEVPFDLSKVMFVATANTVDGIPPALLDRMEVIHITGYTDEEKINIARRHLLPQQMKEHGLTEDSIQISGDTLRQIISGYTREAGVRNLEREIANLCRKAARRIAQEEGTQRVRVNQNNLEGILGRKRFMREGRSLVDEVGVVTGLAWTPVGGETLEIEVNIMPGSGKLELTGHLGDVMKESARTALSCVRARVDELGIDPDFHQNKDIHIHVPEGAIPKDGPSAGVAMAVAMVSALTGKKVSGKVAMTGEITLRGRVLPIGGLKEKTLAAYREGVQCVLLPKGNRRDVAEIPQNISRKLQLKTIETLDEALSYALVGEDGDQES